LSRYVPLCNMMVCWEASPLHGVMPLHLLMTRKPLPSNPKSLSHYMNTVPWYAT
jgi:hypothetical protein